MGKLAWVPVTSLIGRWIRDHDQMPVPLKGQAPDDHDDMLYREYGRTLADNNIEQKAPRARDEETRPPIARVNRLSDWRLQMVFFHGCVSSDLGYSGDDGAAVASILSRRGKGGGGSTGRGPRSRAMAAAVA